MLLLVASASAEAADTTARPGRSGPTTFPRTWSDFNGDGFADAAVGIPGETVDGVKGAGAVLIFYGSATGLSAAGSQLLTLGGQVGPVGSSSPDKSAFGSALAAGDVNDDGYADLVVGAPDHPGDSGATTVKQHVGAICATYGGPDGLEDFVSCLPGHLIRDEANLRLGASVAVADVYDEDGRNLPDGSGDLAFGAPGYEGGRGAVYLFQPLMTTAMARGSRPAGGAPLPVATIEGKQPGERFGSVLRAGSIGRGLADDLVVGVPQRDVIVNGRKKVDAGAVDIIYDGKITDGARVTVRQGSGVGDGPEAGDRFGAAVAVGDVTSDGWDDVVVGAPREDLGGKADTGIVHVLRTLQLGELGAGFRILSMASSVVPGNSAAGDLFGSALAIGELGDPDGLFGLDLAVGVPGRTVSGRAGAGAVVAFASNGGDVGGVARLVTQDSPQIRDTAEKGDGFGAALFVGEYGRGGWGVLIGIPREDVGTVKDAGAVHVLYAGTTTLLVTAGARFITQETTGVPGRSGAGDRMGSSIH